MEEELWMGRHMMDDDVLSLRRWWEHLSFRELAVLEVLAMTMAKKGKQEAIYPEKA